MTSDRKPATKASLARWLNLRLSVGLALALATSPVIAADLPFFPAGARAVGPGPFQTVAPRATFGGLLPDAVFVGPPRFDVYGHPIYGTVQVAAPNPLFASTGCPAALQPVYDAVGNFAGYSAIEMCR